MAETTEKSGVSGRGYHQKGAVSPVLVIGGLVIVALIGVIVALVLNMNRPEPVVQQDGPRQRSIVINEDNINDALDDFDTTPVEAGYYQARMTTTWTFPDGASPSTDAYVENVTNNTHDVYFDVQLMDTEETIYESGVIPRGGYLDNITLDRDLDPGTYDAVVIYHLIDAEQRTVSTLRMAVTITVES